MNTKKILKIFLAIVAFFAGLFAIIMIAGTASILLSNLAIKIFGPKANTWEVAIAVIVSAIVMIMCIKPVGWISKKWANWINSIC